MFILAGDLAAVTAVADRNVMHKHFLFSLFPSHFVFPLF
jgi:hypothetical protein